MKTAIKYRLSTNQCVGTIEASSDRLLQLQIDNLPADIGAIEVAPDHPAMGERKNWYILAGLLTEKTELTLFSDKSVITANGIDEAIVSVTPATAVDLRVNGQVIALAAGETLSITSDIPRAFNILMVPGTNTFADPIQIKAL